MATAPFTRNLLNEYAEECLLWSKAAFPDTIARNSEMEQQIQIFKDQPCFPPFMEGATRSKLDHRLSQNFIQVREIMVGSGSIAFRFVLIP